MEAELIGVIRDAGRFSKVGVQEGDHLGDPPPAQSEQIQARRDVHAPLLVPQVRAGRLLPVRPRGQKAPASPRRGSGQEAADAVMALVPGRQ